jgi:hypothetical protein
MNARNVAALRGASLTALVALLAGCTLPGIETAPKVPEALRVPPNQRLALEADATGVQIYDCKPVKDSPARFEWTLRAPEAQLFDITGKRIGKHYGGPTWESYDGSKVVGEVKARSDSPDANAIPWLLLSAKSTSGDGVLGQTATIQRAATVGGKAPSEGCGPTLAGNEVRVPYTAKYYFYEAKR